MISITSLTITNFKLFDEVFIDFTNSELNSRLVTLDGPNGFGKTTIYDAIEVCLTGRIERFSILDRAETTGEEMIPFLKKQGENLEIELRIQKINHGETSDICLICRVNPQEGFNNKNQKKVSEFWKNIKRYIKIDNEEIEANQESINELIGYDIKQYYSTTQYLTQDDPTKFLKNSDETRAKHLKNILNIDDTVESKVSKLIRIKELLVARINKIEDEINNNIISKSEVSNIAKVDFVKIINSGDPIPFDTENFQFNDEQHKTRLITNLVSLKELVSNLNDYKNWLFNKTLDSYKNDQQILELYIYFVYYLDNLDNLKSEFDLLKSARSISEITQSLNLIKSNKFKLKELLTSILDDDQESNDLYEKLITTAEDILLLQQTETDIAQSVRELQEDRKNLNDHLIKFCGLDSRHSNSECPYCGHDYKLQQFLIDSVDAKSISLAKLLDASSTLIKTKKDELNQYYEFIKKQIELKTNSIGEFEYYTQLDKINVNHSRLQFLQKLVPDSTRFLVSQKKLIDSVTMSQKLQALNNSISSLQKNLERGEGEYLVWSKLMNQDLVLSLKQVSEIRTEDIDNKITYLNFIYDLQNSIKNKGIDAKILTLKKQNLKLNNLTKKLNEIIDIYKKESKAHNERIIKAIEIPFHIYTGKLLQSFFDGNGLFLKDFDESQKLNRVRIVMSNDDHDILYKMSTGQTVSAITALMLTMNKIYSKEFKTLFIDDPFQSLDDINIHSFIEILRNDFSDYQILFSTHSDELSMQIRYKYLKFKQNVKSIDMQKLYYESIRA